MLLDPDTGEIELAPLGAFLRSLSGLRYAELPPDKSLFDPPFVRELEIAVQDFVMWIEDRPEQEVPLMRGLAWTLNLPPGRLERFIYEMTVPFRYRDVSEFHRFLVMLWSAAFADWRVKDFDPDAYSFTGPTRYRPLP